MSSSEVETTTKCTWQKGIVISVAFIELCLSVSYIGYCLWCLIVTSGVNLQKLIGFQFRLLLIVMIRISTLEVITCIIGSFSIMKDRLCITAMFCVLSLAYLICYFVEVLFLFIEKQNLLDDVAINIDAFGTPEEYNIIRESLDCSITVKINATTIFSDIKLCAINWMELSITVNIGIGISQFVLLLLLVILACALHKLMVEIQNEFLFNRGHEYRSEWFNNRRNKVVPLRDSEWTRTRPLPSAPSYDLVASQNLYNNTFIQ